MFSEDRKEDKANYKEVSDKLKRIRSLLATKTGRQKVYREVRRKWL